MWSIEQSEDFKHAALQIDPNQGRFVDCFAGALVVLARDPYACSHALFDDEQRRLLVTSEFMAGFVLYVGLVIDEDRHTVILNWVERVPADDAYSAYEEDS